MEYKTQDFPSFARIASALPTMSNQILGYVGNQSKQILKDEFLHGQQLDYRGKWKDKRGRSKVTYGIKYGKYVTIRSYPANFFTVPNARQRKREIWSGLREKTNSRLQSILNEFDAKYLKKEFEKFVSNPLSRQRF